MHTVDAGQQADLAQLLELEPADPPSPAARAAAYAESEVRRLRELEAQLEAQLRQTREQIMAVRGGINAYLDVIAYLKEGRDGLDDPGHLG